MCEKKADLVVQLLVHLPEVVAVRVCEPRVPRLLRNQHLVLHDHELVVHHDVAHHYRVPDCVQEQVHDCEGHQSFLEEKRIGCVGGCTDTWLGSENLVGGRNRIGTYSCKCLPVPAQ